MKQIKFSGDYGGKLTHEYFTTIRRWTQVKEDYYKNAYGETFAVIHKDGLVATYADLISTSESILLKDIPRGFLMLDTGTETIEQALEVFQQWKIRLGTPMMVLLFKQAKPPKQERELEWKTITKVLECETA